MVPRQPESKIKSTTVPQLPHSPRSLSSWTRENPRKNMQVSGVDVFLGFPSNGGLRSPEFRHSHTFSAGTFKVSFFLQLSFFSFLCLLLFASICFPRKFNFFLSFFLFGLYFMLPCKNMIIGGLKGKRPFPLEQMKGFWLALFIFIGCLVADKNRTPEISFSFPLFVQFLW